MLTVTQNLVLPTAITGSYPRPLWFDASLNGRPFKAALGESLFREQYLDAVALWKSPPAPQPCCLSTVIICWISAWDASRVGAWS